MVCVQFFVIFCINLSLALNSNQEINLVHVIFRHGIRTPADTYPKDPYISETFYPDGWGQLTKAGKVQMYQNGLFIRNRYDNFLGKYYNNKIAYVRATDSDRTITSAQLMCAAIWPPYKEQQWSQLNWQPVPVRSDPLNEDNLLLVRKPCAQYHIELDKIKAEGEVAEKSRENLNLFQTLCNITGLKINDFDDVQSLYSTLRAEEIYGLKLPKWTEQYYPHPLQDLTDYSYIVNAYNDKLKRLKGGVLLKKLLVDWNQIANLTNEYNSELIKLMNSKEWIKEAAVYGDITNERKIFLYAGHDSTITNLLQTLNVWELQNPDYGITAIFELIKDTKTNEFGIQIFLRNDTKTEPHLLTIPGCTSFCSLKKLIEIVDPVIPRNWFEECYDPYYITPELGGP